MKPQSILIILAMCVNFLVIKNKSMFKEFASIHLNYSIIYSENELFKKLILSKLTFKRKHRDCKVLFG